MEFIAHLIGYIGTALAITSFQINSRKGVLLFQTLANTMFTIHFFMLGAYAGVAMNIISAIRCMTFYYKDSFVCLQSKFWMYLFCVIFVGAGVVTWEGPLSLFVILGGIITTVSFFMTNPGTVRKIVWANSPCWLVYNIMHGSWAGFITETFALTSIFIAIWRYDIKVKLKK